MSVRDASQENRSLISNEFNRSAILEGLLRINKQQMTQQRTHTRMARRDFNPLDIILQLEADIRRSSDGAMRALLFQPSLDMYETDGALVVKMELAGVRPDRLSITLSADDRILTITGERTEPSTEHQDRIRCHHLEIYYGAFEREIRLPGSVQFDRDHITANYRDGFLTISLQKRAKNTNEKQLAGMNLCFLIGSALQSDDRGWSARRRNA
jgi:HSP20 family protein